MVKSSGSGTLLHTKKISLTVLLKPSPPRVLPAAPAATEGRPLNLTCSSTGGSPPPQVSGRLNYSFYQCCGSMTFWCGSGSGSADPCWIWIRILLFSSFTFKMPTKN
jgi:hypothetical protein